MVPVSFSLVAFVAFVAFVDLRSRLLTLDHLRTSSHGARLIAALAFTSRCHIDGKSNRLLGRKFYCGFWRGKIQRILISRFKAP